MIYALCLSALLSGQSLDTTTTLHLLARPSFHEANPFLPASTTGIVAVKVGVTSAAVLAGWKLRHTHPKLAVLVLATGAASGWAGTGYNLRHLLR